MDIEFPMVEVVQCLCSSTRWGHRTRPAGRLEEEVLRETSGAMMVELLARETSPYVGSPRAGLSCAEVDMAYSCVALGRSKNLKARID